MYVQPILVEESHLWPSKRCHIIALCQCDGLPLFLNREPKRLSFVGSGWSCFKIVVDFHYPQIRLGFFRSAFFWWTGLTCFKGWGFKPRSRYALRQFWGRWIFELFKGPSFFEVSNKFLRILCEPFLKMNFSTMLWAKGKERRIHHTGCQIGSDPRLVKELEGRNAADVPVPWWWIFDMLAEWS